MSRSLDIATIAVNVMIYAVPVAFVAVLLAPMFTALGIFLSGILALI